MIRFRLGGLAIRIHPVLLIMLAMDVLSGGAADTAALAASLALHELSHAASARALKIRVVELELMPFGSAARLENAWGLRPGQMTLVALSGPVMNALLLMLCTVLFKARALPPYVTAPIARANLTLLMFNLLPALPLDGGRVLCGLLGRKLGQARAARIGVNLGRVLAGALIALAVLGLVLLGQINVSLLLCAVFILSSGPRERLAAGGGSLMSLLDRQSELEGEGALPVRWLAASTEAPLRQTIAQFSPRAMHRIAVYDSDLRLAGVLEEGQLLKAALNDANMALGQLLGLKDDHPLAI